MLTGCCALGLLVNMTCPVSSPLLAQEEVRMRLEGGEGPIGMVICPSRELARQTYDIVVAYSEALRAGAGADWRFGYCPCGLLDLAVGWPEHARCMAL